MIPFSSGPSTVFSFIDGDENIGLCGIGLLALELRPYALFVPRSYVQGIPLFFAESRLYSSSVCAGALKLTG